MRCITASPTACHMRWVDSSSTEVEIFSRAFKTEKETISQLHQLEQVTSGWLSVNSMKEIWPLALPCVSIQSNVRQLTKVHQSQCLNCRVTLENWCNVTAMRCVNVQRCLSWAHERPTAVIFLSHTSIQKPLDFTENSLVSLQSYGFLSQFVLLQIVPNFAQERVKVLYALKKYDVQCWGG